MLLKMSEFRSKLNFKIVEKTMRSMTKHQFNDQYFLLLEPVREFQFR